MIDEQRPRTSRWPLLAVLAGVVLLVTALVGWSVRGQPTGLPASLGAGTAVALAGTPAPRPAPRPALPSGTQEPSSAPAAVASAPPARLQIEGLRVDAPVVPVGVDAAGDIAVPDDVANLGWYRYGPAPGTATGSIVIVGHVDSATQGEGALFTLTTVKADATITVTTADGRQWHYRVVGREAYPKTSVPLGALFSAAGAPRLTLITCGGRFDEADRSYADNIVVTAVPA